MVNQQPVAKTSCLFRWKLPIAQRRDVGIDKALFVGAPAGRMIGIGAMIEHSETKRFVPKGTLDIAPRGALLFACTTAKPVRIEVGLARIGFVPRHPHGQSTHEELPE